MTKFKNIEFLRFILALFIVAFHLREGYFITLPKYLHGINYASVCVDFFFIIAGFFLFRTFNINKDTWDFAKKRFLRLAPNLWLLVFLIMICSGFIKDIRFIFSDNILRMLLLGPIGFSPPTGGIGAVIIWFIPCLFWVSLFYFYLAKIFETKKLNLIVWLLVVSSISLYMQYMHFIPDGNVKNVYYIFNIGIVRAVAGIGLGYFVNMLYSSGFLFKCSQKQKWLISLLELYLCSFLLHYLTSSSHLPGKTSFLFIVMFTFLFYLFLIKQGIISNLLENKISVWLGKYSYAIYCIHPIILALFKAYGKVHKVFVTTHSVELLVTIIIINIVAGILTYHLYEKPVHKYCNRRFLNKFPPE